MWQQVTNWTQESHLLDGRHLKKLVPCLNHIPDFHNKNVTWQQTMHPLPNHFNTQSNVIYGLFTMLQRSMHCLQPILIDYWQTKLKKAVCFCGLSITRLWWEHVADNPISNHMGCYSLSDHNTFVATGGGHQFPIVSFPSPSMLQIGMMLL